MRFEVQVDTDWRVAVRGPAFAAGPPKPRPLRKADDGARGFFPLPPANEIKALAPSLRSLCDGQQMPQLLQLYDRLARRAQIRGPRGASDIEVFGRYLFHTLIGETTWASILQAASAGHSAWIELALSWPAPEHFLNRLNWEMMHGPTQFLLAGQPPVVMTRIVVGATARPASLRLPPRVLFILGSDLSEASIRPGAEIMGLLQRLECEGRGIHPQVLFNATPERLRWKMGRFRPDVVHFICHGQVDPATWRGCLLLKMDEPKTDPRRFADQLLQLLKVENAFPPIVVLSACESAGGAGRLLGAPHVAPLATELVAGGVPIVVAMAGRVADRACRLFTRGFGEALLAGKPLLQAAIGARREAIAEGETAYNAIDWAFPAVFLSPEVEPGYAGASVAPNDPALALAGWIRSYDLERKPVFCGREKFFEAYADLFEPTGHRVLAVEVEQSVPGYGRTRLLQELAAQALRDGHLPCLLALDKPTERVRHLPDFALRLLKAAEVACEVFDFQAPDCKQVRLLNRWASNAAELLQQPELDPEVKKEIGDGGQQITPKAVLRALQRDFLALLARYRQRLGPGTLQDPRRLFVLVNKVDQLDAQVGSAFLYDFLGPHGLGTPGEPMPVALCFSLDQSSSVLWREWQEKKRGPGWLNVHTLKPFSAGEDILAVEQVLLHPFRPALLPGVSDVPYVINSEVDPATAALCEGFFRILLQRGPIAFEGSEFFGTAKIAAAQDYLRPANDRAWQEEQMRKRFGNSGV